MNNPEEIDLVIIIPVFNAQPYLERCLNSVIQQKGARFRVLIVNDGSTDLSQDTIDRYYKKYSHLISKFLTPNRGTGPARNFGLSKLLEIIPPDQVDRVYVTFVDADDWIEERAIELLFAQARRCGSDIVFSDHFFHREGQRNLVTGFWGTTLTDPVQRLCCSNVSTVWAKLVRLSLFKDLSFPALVHEDAVIAPILFRKAHGVAYLPTPLYNYNARRDSKTGAGDFHLKPDIFSVINTLMDRALESEDAVLLQFTFEYYLTILVEYKNKVFADYDHFEELNDNFLSRLSFDMLTFFQNCAIRRIQAMNTTQT